MTGNASRRDGEDPNRIASRNGNVTAREREVLHLVGAGHADAEIAEVLGIARSTVATLLLSSMVKLGAKTRIEAATKSGADRR
jgi:DNA-binding CsgD family transcriptional regulator